MRDEMNQTIKHNGIDETNKKIRNLERDEKNENDT